MSALNVMAFPLEQSAELSHSWDYLNSEDFSICSVSFPVEKGITKPCSIKTLIRTVYKKRKESSEMITRTRLYFLLVNMHPIGRYKS